MKFKNGDKVMLDRNSSFFQEEVLSYKPEAKEKSEWWTELEEKHPLTIKSVEDMGDNNYKISVKESDFLLSSEWIVLFNMEY